MSALIDDRTAAPAAASAVGTRTRAGVYIGLILLVALLAAYYRLRTDSLFGCQALGYSSGRFLSYCQTTGYGDFDHGAFWFNLEPAAARAAAGAQILFLGNSRLQYGFSSSATQEWLQHNANRYYLLGFAYGAGAAFESKLLRRLRAHPRVYVINLDGFFSDSPSVPARMVMDDPGAQAHYTTKLRWQFLHRVICGPLASLCGTSYGIYRDSATGIWTPFGAISASEAASTQANADPDVVRREAPVARQFLDQLGVDPSCVIFTLVPTVDAPRPTAAALSAALHVDFIAPAVDDLLTFDGSHLDRLSAEQWSSSFFAAAGPRIRRCLTDNRRSAALPAAR